MFKKHLYIPLAGILAGGITGLLGAGGGMVLVPLLSAQKSFREEEIFPSSVAIILPVCIVSLCFRSSELDLHRALPYLAGSALGGIIAGIIAKKIPTVWLHRTLGLLILFGGVRYLC